MKFKKNKLNIQSVHKLHKSNSSCFVSAAFRFCNVSIVFFLRFYIVVSPIVSTHVFSEGEQVGA